VGGGGNKSDNRNLDTRTVSRFLRTGVVPGYRLSSLLLRLYKGAVSRGLEMGLQLRGGLVSGGRVQHGMEERHSVPGLEKLYAKFFGLGGVWCVCVCVCVTPFFCVQIWQMLETRPLDLSAECFWCSLRIQ